jgi:hypothetical protein
VPAEPVFRATPLIAGLHRTPPGATLGGVFFGVMEWVVYWDVLRFALSGFQRARE